MNAQHASSPIRGILLILASIAAAFLALTMVAPSTASAAVDPAAETAASNPVDDIVDATTPFIVDDGVATPYFDDEAAIAAGASDDVLTAGAAFDALIAARADVEEGPGRIGSERDDLLTPSNGFPVWGNWCGPGHGGGPAVDTLDRLCQRHDNCYAERGYFDCYCDAQLKAEIDRYSHQMTSGERAMAAAVKMVFSTGICNPF